MPDFYNEEEKDNIVNRLSDDLLIDSLKEQIDHQIVITFNPTNFLSVFNNRFAVLTTKYQDYEELMKKFNDIKLNLFMNVLSGIENKFDIDSNMEPEYMSRDNYYYYVKKMYEFFVLDYRKNLVEFVVNYIHANKTEIIRGYKASTDKKDLGVIALRRSLTDLEDVVVIHNIEDIVSNIVNSTDIESEYIIETIIEGDESESRFLAAEELFVQSITDGSLGKNFSEIFLKPLVDDNSSFEVLNDIKNQLLKTAPKKEA